MVSRAALSLAVALGLAAVPVRADSPHLAEARRAVEAVDYDAARRLLVDALHDGGNSLAAVREIYRLSARAAVVLDQRELAEQYYRRWLAIDPDAALPDDTAPKLREPFVAAQAYSAAHGRLRATARRTQAGEIDVELIAVRSRWPTPPPRWIRRTPRRRPLHPPRPRPRGARPSCSAPSAASASPAPRASRSSTSEATAFWSSRPPRPRPRCLLRR